MTIVLAGSLTALAAATETGSTGPGLQDVGTELFQRHCTACHGSAGAGDGAAGSRLATAPANLTDGLVKFRSTSQGTAPLRSDFERTIRAGSRGTAMVEWGSFLDAAAIASLASHVLALEGYAGASTVDPGLRPLPSLSSPAPAGGDGAALYARFGCAQCHGDDRRGGGPAAATLADAGGRRIPVPDLGVLPFKRGNDPIESAKTLLYGMDGTPMAAFEGAITEEQALALARWLVDSATAERSGWIGEEHLGYMIAMHESARGMGMGGRGMNCRHGMSGERDPGAEQCTDAAPCKGAEHGAGGGRCMGADPGSRGQHGMHGRRPATHHR